MSKNWSAIVVVAIVLMLVLCVCCGEGLAQRWNAQAQARAQANARAAAARQSQIQAIRAKIAVGQGVLAQAQAMGSVPMSKLEAAREQLEDASATIEAADAEQASLRKQLHDIEETLVSAQPANSPVGLARDAYLKAKEDVNRHRQRILDSPEHQARLKRVGDSPDAGKLRAAIRNDALKDDYEYQTALTALQDARQHFEPLKRELCANDSNWTQISQLLRESIEKGKAAKDQMPGGVSQLASIRQVRSAQQLASAAQAIIEQGKARLRQMGVNPDAPMNPPPAKKK